MSMTQFNPSHTNPERPAITKKIALFSNIKLDGDQICLRYAEGTYSEFYQHSSNAAYIKQVSNVELRIWAYRVPGDRSFAGPTAQAECAILVIDASNKHDVGNMEFLANRLATSLSKDVNCVVLVGTNASKISEKEAKEFRKQMQALQNRFDIESIWLVDPQTGLDIDKMFDHIAGLAPLAELKTKVDDCVTYFKNTYPNEKKKNYINDLLLNIFAATSYATLRNHIIALQRECKISGLSFFAPKIPMSLDINQVFDKNGHLKPNTHLKTQSISANGIELSEMKENLLSSLNVSSDGSEEDIVKKDGCFTALRNKFC